MDNNNAGFSMKQGYLWFVDGWHIFKQQPVLFILGSAVWIGLEVALAFIPVAGEVIEGLLFPVMYAGFLSVIHEIDSRQKSCFRHFFQGFTDISKLKNLLLLGSMMVFLELLEVTLTMILGPLGALVLAAPLGILILSSLLYSVPLVFFADSKPIEAIKSSYNSCGQNISALISFYLNYWCLRYCSWRPLASPSS